MKIASVATVKAHLSAYLKATATGPVVITKNGKPVAVLLAAGDNDELERLLMAYSPKLRAILDAARKRIGEGRGVPHAEFWAGVQVRRASKRGRKHTARQKPAAHPGA